MFSLRTVIDDILLIVRNSNISESEDLSRVQIASWILSYKAQFIKQFNDKNNSKSNGTDTDDSYLKTIGPLELQDEKSLDETKLYLKRTIKEIPQLTDNSADSIVSVQDQSGCVLQFMHDKRRHFHYFRRYTFGEMTYYYENGYIYVCGTADLNKLKYIWVTGSFTPDGDDDVDEDDIIIPGWMIPMIKESILKTELAFMLNRPSDDINDSSLANVKPKAVNTETNAQ